MARLRDLAASKRDHFMFDPRSIKMDRDYNIRDLSTPDARVSLETLKASLRESGLRVPLLIRLENDLPTLVQGHRRLTAILELIDDGEPWEAVECLAEERKRSSEERTLDLFLSNDGEPLTELEKAEGVRRLVAYGWDTGKIALKLGRSSAYISTLLGYERMPEQAKEMVRDGVVSAAAAAKTLRAEGEVEGVALLQDTRRDAELNAPSPALPLDDAAPKVSRGVRVTPKKIAAAKEKRTGANPKPIKAPSQTGARYDEALFTQINKFLGRCIDGTYDNEDDEVPDRLVRDAKDLAETIKLSRQGFRDAAE